jgi:hypothetical protein
LWEVWTFHQRLPLSEEEQIKFPTDFEKCNIRKGKHGQSSNWQEYKENWTSLLHPGGDYTERRTGDDGTFLVANHPAVILFDFGASHTFIINTFVENHCIHSTKSREGFIIHSPGGQIFTKEVVFHVPICRI